MSSEEVHVPTAQADASPAIEEPVVQDSESQEIATATPTAEATIEPTSVEQSLDEANKETTEAAPFVQEQPASNAEEEPKAIVVDEMKAAESSPEQPSQDVSIEPAAEPKVTESIAASATSDMKPQSITSEENEMRELQEIPEDRVQTGQTASSTSYEPATFKIANQFPSRPITEEAAEVPDRIIPDFMNLSPKRTFGPLQAKTPLDLVWAFGFNAKGSSGIYYIGSFTDSDSELIFYVSGHIGVIFDRLQNAQYLLQGHNNAISSTCLSANRQWVVTCDSGSDGMIMVWDTRTRVPVRSYFANQLPDGVASLDLSHDAMYLVTLSGGSPQHVSLWDWTDESQDTPLMSVTLDASIALQTRISFHPENPRQIVSNGSSEVVFYSWEYGGSLNFEKPNTANIPDKSITLNHSLFVPGSSQAVTSTADGRIVVWQNDSAWSAFKLMKIANCPITTLSVAEGYLAYGLENGTIQFTDFFFRVVSWNNKIELGAITAISFAPSMEDNFTKTARSKTASLGARDFVIPNYIVATSQGALVYVAPAVDDWLTVVVRSQDSAVATMASHPSKKLLAVASLSGAVHVWNYESRQVELSTRLPDGRCPQCMVYSPNGNVLAVGQTNGVIVLLDAITLTALAETSEFRVSKDAVSRLVFSSNSQYLAFADGENCVGYLQNSGLIDWTYIGRYKSHSKTVVDILFADSSTTIPRLFSIGQDRMLVEYDMENSSFDGGLVLKGQRVRAEQSATPTAMLWYPQPGKEQFIVTANSQFKFKMYNGTTRLCRRTVLGPTFGHHVDRLVPVFQGSTCYVLAFSAHNKVGVTLLPADGNVHRHMASVAHPSRVTSLVASFDGNFLFSSGEGSAGIHIWQVNAGVLGTATRLGGEGLQPFLNMLDDKSGDFLHQLEDYFYYAQIRAQGEDSMEPRKVSETIPISEVPFVFRALGCFLSEYEIQDLLNEIKFSRYAETQEFVTEVNVAQVIQLYLNHRPAQGVGLNLFADAFKSIASGATIDAGTLVQALLSKGEKMTETELAQYLTSLLGTGFAQSFGSSPLIHDDKR